MAREAAEPSRSPEPEATGRATQRKYPLSLWFGRVRKGREPICRFAMRLIPAASGDVRIHRDSSIYVRGRLKSGRSAKHRVLKHACSERLRTEGPHRTSLFPVLSVLLSFLFHCSIFAHTCAMHRMRPASYLTPFSRVVIFYYVHVRR